MKLQLFPLFICVTFSVRYFSGFRVLVQVLKAVILICSFLQTEAPIPRCFILGHNFKETNDFIKIRQNFLDVGEFVERCSEKKLFWKCLTFFLENNYNGVLFAKIKHPSAAASVFNKVGNQRRTKDHVKHRWWNTWKWTKQNLWKTAFKKFYLFHSWILCPIC